MVKLITGIVMLHAILAVLGYVFHIRVKMIPMVYTRYFYVVVHELSHLLVGILVGCGVYDLVLKETSESSGAYITKYKSRFKILWVNFGEVFLSLAGPLLPPVFFYFFAYGLLHELYTQLFIALGFGLLLICIYSSQRIYFIVVSLLITGVWVTLGEETGIYLLIILLLWGLLGMVDEVFAIRGFDNTGSDMAVFTEALLGTSHPLLSRLLYAIIQIIYVYSVYLTLQLLLQTGI